MNDIQIFNNPQFGQVRTLGTSDEPWFCATDVCKALGYTNVRKAITDHVDTPDVTKRDIGVQTGLKADGTPSIQTMSVTFVNKDFIHKINKDYRNIDRPTDVISFAFLDDPKERQIKSDNPIDIGEIYICVEVAYENADIYGNSHDRELKFLFVHGVLHLLGYDHMEKEDEKIMFALQDKILGDK